MKKILPICFALIFIGCSFYSNNEIEKENILEKNNETIKVISAFGDSITAGFGVSEEEAYPAQLQKKITNEGYHNYLVINNGVSGETTAGGLARIDWVLDNNVSILILVLGGNDMLRGIDVDNTYYNLSRIIEKAQEKNVQVILGGMEAFDNLGVDYVTSFNALYPRLSKEYNIPLIPFFLEGVALNPLLNIDDGIHPNAKGYNIVVENIWPYLEAELK